LESCEGDVGSEIKGSFHSESESDLYWVLAHPFESVKREQGASHMFSCERVAADLPHSPTRKKSIISKRALWYLCTNDDVNNSLGDNVSEFK